MSDPAAEVALLRKRIERQEQELESAVRELAGAARRSVAPTHWVRENPFLGLAGALVVGWWLGRRARAMGFER